MKLCRILGNIFKEVKARVATGMEMSVKPLIVCHGYGWTFPVFSEGFVCGGEVNIQDTVKCFNGCGNDCIQFIHIVSTLGQGKKTSVLALF